MIAAVSPSPAQITSNQDWARQLLAALGDPETTSNIDFISAWEQTEGGAPSVNFFVEHNPISASYPIDGSFAFNGYGIQSYPTFQAGIEGAVGDIEGVPGKQDPLAPKLQADLAKGNTPYQQLANDLAYGNSVNSWSGAGGSGKAAYAGSDAPSIMNILTGNSGLNTQKYSPITGTQLASNGAPATGPTSSSNVSSALSRIVIGLIALMLLGIGVDQLFKGGNSPTQVMVQGLGNTAQKAKKAAKGTAKAGVTAAAE